MEAAQKEKGWKHYASTKLFDLIQSGEPFTSPDLVKKLEGMDYPSRQIGNFLNSWHSKGVIQRVGSVPAKRHGKNIHIYRGTHVSDVTKYQVMPDMSPERYQEVYEDIKENGIQVPIIIDEDGVIIDGHHRSRIANELGIPCPVEIREGLSESQKFSLAYSLNMKRRDLSPEKRRELIAKSLLLDPLKRDQEHARLMGVDRKTVKRVREEKGIPRPDDVIREYAEERPEKSNREVARDLGVSDHTVASVRGAQKREFPENAHPDDEPEPVAPNPDRLTGPNEEIPATTIIGTKDLEELNQPATKPTPEQEEETINFTMRGKSNQKQQIRAAERLAIQLDSITVALDHEFPVRVFDRTFTKENAAELAEALQRSARKLKIHANRLTEYAQGA